MGIDERREYARVGFRTVIDLTFPDQEFHHCETRDLSVAGTFIAGLRDRQRGTFCHVILHLSGESSDLLLKMRGEVVRIENGGVAIQFVDVDPDSFFHLKNIVYLNYLQNSDDISFSDARPSAQILDEMAVYEDDDLDDADDDEEIEVEDEVD